MTLHRAPIAARRVVRTSAATVLAGMVLVSCTSTSTPAPRTAKVERSALTTGVSASGALTAISEENLGFAKGGQLTKVMVAVGQHVTAGEPLATVDPFPYRQTLAQQKANLKQQQATLSKLTSSPAVQGSQDSLSQAQTVVDATKNQADATAQADSVAIDRAHKQLDFDNYALDQARKKQSDDQDSCGDPSAVTASTNPACAASAQDDAAVTAAERTVVADKTAIDTTEQKQSVDQAAGELAVANAQQGAVTAQNNAASASSDRPFNLDAQSAIVSSAQAAVDQAQRDLDRTTLTAPVDGTISALNGAVGEFLAPSAATTAQAPGSGAPIPGAGAVSAAVAGAAATAGRPGGTQFIVLDDIHQFQLVVPFGESDAAQIQPDQKVHITLDAVPDLVADGTVVSVAPSGTAISGVISYYVTIGVDNADPRLKDGLSAHAAVVTHESDNVLTVPNAAVHRAGGKSVVDVLGSDGTQTPVPFTPGTVGDQRTEVTSGLQDGQQIVLPAGQ